LSIFAINKYYFFDGKIEKAVKLATRRLFIKMSLFGSILVFEKQLSEIVHKNSQI
jgi:hypothetical protein